MAFELAFACLAEANFYCSMLLKVVARLMINNVRLPWQFVLYLRIVIRTTLWNDELRSGVHYVATAPLQ